MIFYKMYPYSVKATLLSAGSSVLAFVLALLAILSFSNIDNIILKVLAVAVLAAGAVFSFVYLSRQLPDKIAEKEFNTRIVSDAKYAYNYCSQNPQHYDAVAQGNPDFAEKYCLNEKGKVVKRK